MQCLYGHRTLRGFTLIEMLVVLMIMGILLGLVQVVIQPDARGILRIEAERLARLLDLANTEASLTGKAIGWTGDETSYRFWRLGDDASWTEVRDNDLLRARVLPPAMALTSLRVENVRPRGAMRLVFSPYAPPTFFIIELSLGGERYSVAAMANGTVRAAPLHVEMYGALAR